MTKIDPNKEYSIEEVVEQGLIPGITGHTGLYNLLTHKVESGDGKKSRVHNKETTETTIKPVNTTKPWNKISGKIKVEGREIIKFLKVHNLI